MNLNQDIIDSLGSQVTFQEPYTYICRILKNEILWNHYLQHLSAVQSPDLFINSQYQLRKREDGNKNKSINL